ncbi:putative protein kinase RLK-Pelle-CrRLK1L-1 family [Helianthus debilis subsp. tardiflorus]
MEKFQHLEIQLEDIKEATNDFNDEKNRIGRGGFGNVYKGELSHSEGRSTVAIKRLNLDPRNLQGTPEFLKEITTLSRYKHENLISLLGFCCKGSEMILVYEHASRGSLDRHLNSPLLTWSQRIKICLDAAKGLRYLHDPRGTHQRLIHCDVKSANILLDDQWNAKVSDFGLSIMGSANEQNSVIVTLAAGTAGYCDPQYAMTHTLTKESDVYSLGVVLFEVLCGTFCCTYSNGRVQQNFVSTWIESYKEKKLNDIIFKSPTIETLDQSTLETFSDIAYQCLKESREDRPTMAKVVTELETALRYQKDFVISHAPGEIIPLVGLLCGRNYMLHEASSRALVKLAFAELLRILTNNATIAKGPSAAKVVEPLFMLLTKAEFGPDGQHSALQVLVNILEHPQCRADYSLTSHQAIEPLIPLLDSPAPAVQQLSAELLSHLLLEEHYQKDPVSQQVIGPLMRVLGSGIPILQQRAVKALVSIASTWPNEIAKEGGVAELSKVILLSDPSLPHTLLESAAAVLSSILQFSSEYFLEVPIAVLVRLLRSGSEATVIGALNALLVLESDDSSSSIAMAESGAIEALLELLRGHQCEDTAARLLEVLLHNVKIREIKASKLAILPLSQYLLDPQTQAQQARLLATLALGDLFRNETLARSSDAVSACRALVNVLEDQPSEEMKLVAICALQNLVMDSRSNKRAVAEAGGVQVVLDLIGSSDTDTSVQSAMFIKLLFSNNTIQEYASSETVRAITAAIDKDLRATGTVNEEYLKALNALFGNFPRLRITEPATLSIPHLLTSLKTGSEATQEAALDALFLLRQAWSACPAEVSRSQSNAAADAIPLLQYLIQSGPPRFQEKAELLLQRLPGTLTVIIKRGNNMKQLVGNPSAYCKLTLGNTPSRQTKVVSTGPDPEWDESFVWSFESPPKGQKLHISCKNKSKMGKSSFGQVTIQIDRVVMFGAVAGEYTLLPESKSGASRNLEIEFQWSNK